MRLLVKIFIFILFVCSFISLLSPIYWLFDLFNHFRIHFLLTSILLLIVDLNFSKNNITLLLFILLGNLILVLIPLYQSGGISQISDFDGRQKIRIVSSNVFKHNTQYQNTINVITHETPDIIALTETDDRWIKNFNAVKGTFKHSINYPRSDNFGMAVYSKLPFQAKIQSIGDYHLPLVVLDFENFRLIVAHPMPPISHNNLRENRIYLKAIAQNAINQKKPVIIAGDLNSTLWGEAVKPLFDAGLKRINSAGVAYTWPTQIPLFAMQIDHFFAKGISEADFKVLSNIGSDHYPIMTTVILH
jgi:endonuclease/exonuclease/phosphatase (EEP) superfamily protein YafD